MSGYPHDMGKAQEIWRRTTEYPYMGTVIILASVDEFHLDPKGNDQPTWVAQVTASIDMIENQQNSRNSCYFYYNIFGDKNEAINHLLSLLQDIKKTETKVSLLQMATPRKEGN
jgi:hypothetical protein